MRILGWRLRSSLRDNVKCFSTTKDFDALVAQLLGRESIGQERSFSAAEMLTPEQHRAIMAAMNGYSVFVHLNTGAGKSLTYQAPALMQPQSKMTLIVSPLVALISDQVSNLRQRGISVAQRISQRGSSHRTQQKMDDYPQLMYTTPEYLLQNAEMKEFVQRCIDHGNLARLIVDEAHCVFEWGNSFRPFYLELGRWKRKQCPQVPVSFATATISDSDIEQLAELFDMQIKGSQSDVCDRSERDRHSRLIVVQQMSDRPNLRLAIAQKSVEPKENAAYIASICRNETAIVYCLTRDESEQVALDLVRFGAQAGVYHAGIPLKRREFTRKQWMTGRLSIICATSAFGLGIDRAHVRHVIHYSIPLSLSAYYQQIGRAGRDAQPSSCLLLYHPSDRSRAAQIAAHAQANSSSSNSRGKNSESTSQALDHVIGFCESIECRREILFSHFDHNYDAKICCRNCDCGALITPLYASFPSPSLPIDRLPATKKAKVQRAGGISHADQVVEYCFRLIRQKAKQSALPKRDILSRAVIAVRIQQTYHKFPQPLILLASACEKAAKFGRAECD